MDKKQMKMIGIVCLVVCAVCVFVAVERYNANAGAVRAINSFGQGSPLSGMLGVGEMKAAVPAATKYALLFAVISGVGGTVMLVRSGASGKGGEE